MTTKLVASAILAVALAATSIAAAGPAATAMSASTPPKLTCSAEETRHSAVISSDQRSSGSPKYTRFCGPASVGFRLGGKAYVMRGGSCYPTLHRRLRGVNIGYFSRVEAPDSWIRYFGMWWTPVATQPAQRVKVAESSITLRGLPDYVGDGTVTVTQTLDGGTFRLVGRNATGRWAGKRVLGRFKCS